MLSLEGFNPCEAMHEHVSVTSAYEHVHTYHSEDTPFLRVDDLVHMILFSE